PDHRPSDRTLVIIPTYNELDNLLTIVSRVNDSAPDVHVRRRIVDARDDRQQIVELVVGGDDDQRAVTRPVVG
ncbi:hypothetical protein C6A85_03790, partial [Mycobacterium sp. ITM-2017-0098]